MLREIVEESSTVYVDLEVVREIRNSVRHFMTGNRAYIGRMQQQQWFRSIDHNKLRLFIFLIDDEPAGYGIISWRDGNPWLTGALLSRHRGKGWGKDLFRQLMSVALNDSDIIYLDAYLWNINAIKMYKSLKFVEVESKDDIITMVYMR